MTLCQKCDFPLKRKDEASHNCMKSFMSLIQSQTKKIEVLEENNSALKKEN